MTVQWTAADIPDQHDRVAVVTGANSGFGYHIAAALAVAGASVVLACRDPQKAESAMASIRKLAPASTVAFLQLDLADLGSVTRFATDFSADHDRLDLLINNAGVMAVDESRTREGFETHLGVNHLGHFALTARLLPAMLSTPGARIASMSSLVHRIGRLVMDDLMFDRRGYNRWQAYSQSKLANLLFTAELQRRLDDAGSAAIAVSAHPGVAHTGLGAEGHSIGNRLTRIGVPLLGRPVASGALPMLRAATDPAVLGEQFYGPRWWVCGPPVLETPSPQARDDDSARALWKASVELTGIDPSFSL